MFLLIDTFPFHFTSLFLIVLNTCFMFLVNWCARIRPCYLWTKLVYVFRLVTVLFVDQVDVGRVVYRSFLLTAPRLNLFRQQFCNRVWTTVSIYVCYYCIFRSRPKRGGYFWHRPIAPRWPQSPWPLDWSIRLRSINRELTHKTFLSHGRLSCGSKNNLEPGLGYTLLILRLQM